MNMYFTLFVGVLCLSLLCYALLYVHFRFAISLKRKSKLVDLLLLSYRCIVTINVLWLFLTVPWVGLQCVIVVFPDHIHLRFYLHNVHVERTAAEATGELNAVYWPHLHTGRRRTTTCLRGFRPNTNQTSLLCIETS